MQCGLQVWAQKSAGEIANFRQVAIFLLMTVLAGCGGGSEDASQPAPENVALTGVIDIEAGTRVDMDNADVLQYFSPATGVQVLPAEFLLAGYVSGSTGTYPDYGWPVFNYFDDSADRYTLPFGPGFEISLQVFETRLRRSSEITLKLTDARGALIAEKTANQSGARISFSSAGIPSGRYNLLVESEGAEPMLYILSAQRVGGALARSFQWPVYEYVQGEAIISLTDQPSVTGAPRAFATQAMSQARISRELAPGILVVKQPALAGKASAHRSADTMAWINTLRRDPRVKWASPNYKVHALNTPVNEPLYSASVLGQQWHYSLINGPVAWQLAPDGGRDVKIAVFDTGLFYNEETGTWHDDLSGNVNGGYDFVDGDNDPADPGNAVGGSVFHGTHVAGTVAALVNGKGGAGVAFNSTLVPVRVLGEGGSGNLADLIAAMKWVVGVESGTVRADVVNLSLGGLPCNDPAVSSAGFGSLQSFITIGAKNRNMLFVAAAGNSATSDPSCPARLDNVFSVSATDGAGKLASYSNYGPTIDLAAPGGDASRGSSGNGQGDLVSSTSAAVVDGKIREVYLGLQGTSMAAPHVSGVLALMKAARPSLNYDQVRGYLNSGELTAPPCSLPCVRTNDLGFGLLDGGKAMQAVLSGGAPELITASPAVASLAAEATQVDTRTITVSPLGDHGATIEQVSTSASWFSATPDAALPSSIEAQGSMAIKLALNAGDISPGISYRGTLDITYSSDTETSAVLTVPVIGQQITDRQARDAGRHFILLVDPNLNPEDNTYDTVAQTMAIAENGQYRFAFVPDDGVEPKYLDEVPPGHYILVAGTDLDNDGLICHAGEACAEYPVAGLRQEIVIEEGQPVQGIRMTTSYSRPSLSAASPAQSPRENFRGYQLLSVESGSAELKAVAP
jgi:serine protease